MSLGSPSDITDLHSGQPSGIAAQTAGHNDVAIDSWTHQLQTSQNQVNFATSDPLLPFSNPDNSSPSAGPLSSMDLVNCSTTSDQLWQSIYNSSLPSHSIQAQQHPYIDSAVFGLPVPTTLELPNSPNAHGHIPSSRILTPKTPSNSSGSANQDRIGITRSSSADQGSERQSPQRDGDWQGTAGEEIPRTEAAMLKPKLSSKSRKHLIMYGRSLKDRSVESRPRQIERDTTMKNTRACSESQKMMRFACQQVRKEAVASFEKQKRRLRSKIGRQIDGVAETYEFGVCLKIFEASPGFGEHLKATMAHLASLERASSEVFGTKDELMHELEDPLGSDSSASSSDDEFDDNVYSTISISGGSS